MQLLGNEVLFTVTSGAVDVFTNRSIINTYISWLIIGIGLELVKYKDGGAEEDHT